MKQYFWIILFLMTCFNLQGQIKANTIFDNIEKAIDSLPPKTTIIYPYLSWCGGSESSMDSIYSSLIEFRDDINIIIITDDINVRHKSKFLSKLNVDKYLSLNEFYNKRLRSRKEMSKMAKDFNKAYGQHEQYMGSAAVFIIKCDRNFHKIYVLENRASELNKDLKSLINKCK